MWGFVPFMKMADAREIVFDDEMPMEVGGYFVKSLTPRFLRTEEDNAQEDAVNRCCPRMSFRQRLVGWLICVVLGLFLQLASFGAVTRALFGHPERLAINYTLANILAVLGTFFLAGPAAQCRKMTKEDRAVTSFVFVLAMVLTIVLAESSPFFGRCLLIIAMVCVQWLALVWYTLSYIPYGRTFARKILRKCVGCCCTG